MSANKPLVDVEAVKVVCARTGSVPELEMKVRIQVLEVKVGQEEAGNKRSKASESR